MTKPTRVDKSSTAKNVVQCVRNDCNVVSIWKYGTTVMWCPTCGWNGLLVEAPTPLPAELDPEDGA